ncbi:zinc finger protein 99-like [Cloeon dipterum]|uniref:zinc finger protein 99-like n=1 Tax=Cloeon dipterum TaxID=197152 RepID=UPI0032202A75
MEIANHQGNPKVKLEHDENEFEEQEMSRFNGSLWCQEGLLIPQLLHNERNQIYVEEEPSLASTSVDPFEDENTSIIEKQAKICHSPAEEGIANDILPVSLQDKNCDDSQPRPSAPKKTKKSSLKSREKFLEIQREVAEKMDRSMQVCLYCNSLFRSTMLYVHIVRHHKSIYIKCNLKKCAGYFFATSQNLEEHVKGNHIEDGNIYKVKYLPRGDPLLKDPYSVANNCSRVAKNQVIKEKNNETSTAKASFPDESMVREYQNITVEEDDCGEDESKIMLQTPAIPVQELSLPATDSMVTCNFCLNKFSQFGIALHIRYHHKGVAFPCNPCKAFFKSQLDLKSHCKIKHGPNAPLKASKCVYCYKNFNSRNTMYRHVRKIHLDVMIKCSIKGCGELFRLKPEMDTHYKILHASDLLKKTLQCEHCPYRASTKKLIKKHVILNHLPKNFACSQCPKKFATKSKVTFHKSTSHVSRRECGHCREWYSYYGYSMHLVEAPCKFCRSSLPCSKALRKHEVSCKNTLKMSCGKCSIVFKNMFDLREHKFSCSFDVERYSNCMKIKVKSIESLKK